PCGRADVEDHSAPGAADPRGLRVVRDGPLRLARRTDDDPGHNALLPNLCVWGRMQGQKTGTNHEPAGAGPWGVSPISRSARVSAHNGQPPAKPILRPLFERVRDTVASENRHSTPLTRFPTKDVCRASGSVLVDPVDRIVPPRR